MADRQWGVVSRAQLIECGVSTSSIDRWVGQGRLHRLYRGVYAVGHAKLRLEGRFMAAVLARGPGAVLSHRSAAYLLEMRRINPDRIDVTTPRRAGHKPPPGVKLHRTRDLRDEDVTVHRGVPITTPQRTLTDLADVLSQRELERTADRAENLRMHAPIQPRNGRKGTPSLNALKHHRAGTTETRNDLEEELLSICDEYGLPRPLVNHPIGRYIADFAWPHPDRRA